MTTNTPLGVTFGSLAVLGPRAILDIAARVVAPHVADATPETIDGVRRLIVRADEAGG